MTEQKYDTESFLKQAVALLQANLNNKISAINTEKSDVSIDPIDSKAWFFNSIPEVFSFGVFVVCGIVNENPIDSISGDSLEKITLQFDIGLADQNWSDLPCFFRLLRYQRALKEVAYENSQSFGNGRQPVIDKLPPAAMKFNGNAFQFAGINLTLTQD